jgi:hypothetical protein
MQQGSHCLLLAIAATLALAPAAAQPVADPEPPGDVQLLVHSELDYLAAADRLITVEAAKATPAAVLDQIRKKSGLTIDVQGALAARPLLSPSFRDAKAETVLVWFAEQIPVSFKAEPPNRLLVIVEEAKPRSDAPAR